MPRAEITLRLLDLPPNQAKDELEQLVRHIKLDIPDADVQFSKVTDTNDAFDSIKIIVEIAVLGIHVYHTIRPLLKKADGLKTPDGPSK